MWRDFVSEIVIDHQSTSPILRFWYIVVADTTTDDYIQFKLTSDLSVSMTGFYIHYRTILGMISDKLWVNQNWT